MGACGARTDVTSDEPMAQAGSASGGAPPGVICTGRPTDCTLSHLARIDKRCFAPDIMELSPKECARACNPISYTIVIDAAPFGCPIQSRDDTAITVNCPQTCFL